MISRIIKADLIVKRFEHQVVVLAEIIVLSWFVLPRRWLPTPIIHIVIWFLDGHKRVPLGINPLDRLSLSNPDLSQLYRLPLLLEPLVLGIGL